MREPAACSLEHWARTRTREPALYEGGVCLSYGEWNEYSDMLADALAGRGLGFDDVIAVRCRNRIEWAVIAVAGAKLDARLLTLGPDVSTRTLRERIIATAASAVIIGDEDPALVAPALEGIQFRLRATMDVAGPGFFNFFDLFPPAAPARFSRAQPAFVAWTTGETGSPRPVTLPRRLAAPASMSRPAMPEHGCSLLTVPLHRSWGAVQFWAALGAGRAAALVRRPEAGVCLETIDRLRVTHWSSYPAIVRQLAALPPAVIGSYDLSSMRDLTVGGAAVDWPLKARLVSIFGPIISEAYGAAETGPIAVMPPGPQSQKPGSCGRPLKGVMVQIRDGSGQHLPPNAVGEIWARTPRSLVCELPQGEGRRDEEGFIAMADMGRIDEDGYLYITGRVYAALDSRRAG